MRGPSLGEVFLRSLEAKGVSCARFSVFGRFLLAEFSDTVGGKPRDDTYMTSSKLKLMSWSVH